MTDNTHASRNSGRNAGSALNIGIGMLIGLIVALIVAYFAMAGGPFRDKANTNTLTPTTGSTDPNAPLYGNQSVGANTGAVTTPSNDPAANEQGAGTGVLMGGQAPANAGLSQKPANANDAAMADDTATAKPKKSDDPIGDLISNKTKPTSDNSAADGSKAPPKADTKTAVQPTTPKTAPKAPNTDAPKAVTPVTAPGAANKNGNYTIQAGSFTDEQNAQKLKKQLATQGQLATITKKQTSDGAVYRVRVGSYASAKDAQAANQKIKGVVLDMP